ncbi:MAG: hypothetical protein JGK23_25340 [Microcoleus sp. PH2017_19_SFW_U_A]|nr:hypothetical protein [Microcoleus sp. PH2017_19_SFW_U_A]
MNSKDLAKYIEATDGISKPWLLVQLRMKKLQERRSQISTEEYLKELTDLHQDSVLINYRCEYTIDFHNL